MAGTSAVPMKFSGLRYSWAILRNWSPPGRRKRAEDSTLASTLPRNTMGKASMVAPRESLSLLSSCCRLARASVSTDCTLSAFFHGVARPNHLVA
ncbi:hypothetical protein FQZ97_856910 [compost metagenome]